jgi:CheY-like chemotaxis protein
MSNGDTGIAWRFLVIEDNEVTARQLQESIPGFIDPPDSAEAEIVPTFDEAEKRMKCGKYDLLILDLKDDRTTTLEADESPIGLEIFEKLKKTRFVPIIFYTALAHKVRSQQTSFIRVVEKTEGIIRVREEVQRVLATRLPTLVRKLEDQQRAYMWDFVNEHWAEFESPHEQADLAYLLARRLARSLEGLAEKLAASVGEAAGSSAKEIKAHPMTMYIKPPIESKFFAGDILLEKNAATENYWIVLTPSCDFANDKVKHVVLAKCEKLEEQKEYKDWVTSTTETSKKEKLENLIGDNRQGKDVSVGLQPERFKFLPGTFFLPNLLVDFQQLRSVSLETLKTFEQITTLDSPFAEAMLARFARYFGRLGTPAIDKKVVLDRLQATLAKSAAGQADPPAAS